MKNSIIILNYNDACTTYKLVNKISQYKNIYKIIIVDNCSTDNSLEILSNLKSEKVEIIETNKNLGYACGNNYGAKYALKKYKPEFLIIANPDIMFEEKIIDLLTQELLKDKNYAIASVRTRNGINAWRLPTFLDTIKSMFLIYQKIFGKSGFYKDNFRKNINFVDVVAGSFFMIKSNVFDQINGFDERTFLYCEENILAKKLFEKNYKTLLIISDVYDHFHAVSIKKAYKSKVKPFKIYYKSLCVYNKEYLKINRIKRVIFFLFYMLAYIERILYDIVSKFYNYFFRFLKSNLV